MNISALSALHCMWINYVTESSGAASSHLHLTSPSVRCVCAVNEGRRERRVCVCPGLVIHVGTSTLS